MGSSDSSQELSRRVQALESRLQCRSLRERLALGVAVVAAFLCTHGMSWAQEACIATGSLCNFVAGEVASAAAVNHNFAQLVAWMEAKVGTVGTAVKMGAVSSGSITLDDDADITGADVIEGYNDLRLRGDGTLNQGYSADLLIEADGDVITSGSVTTAGDVVAGGGLATTGDASVGGTLSITGTAFGAYNRDNYAFDTEYVASTNGFVLVSLNADTDGDRCHASATLDARFVAAEAVHDYASNDTRVATGSFMFPVGTGSTWKVTLTHTSGTCATRLWWIPLAP